MNKTALIFRELTKEDFRVLTAIETGMRYYEWVPIEEIYKYSGLEQAIVNKSLSRLSYRSLIQRSIAAVTGYQLRFKGYDQLALRALVLRGTIEALGSKIDVGKESEIYDALGPSARRLIVKFHREGRISFKHVKRSREHLLDKTHFSWMYASRLAAEREFKALELLYPRVSVPQPVDQNRNVIVMSDLPGVELYKARIKAGDRRLVLNLILEQIKKAYEIGIIHGDLSEFNVMISPEGVSIIDWPQYVTTKHSRALEFLRRDVANILSYFKKKYGIKRSVERAVNWIKD
ncbi:MAG: serine/threonine-protein kinase RIO2 [Halobacteria archaeon]